MPVIDREVLIFAGAGASKGVCPEKFPTTQEFFAQLSENITERPLFQFVMEYLRKDNPDLVVDIEQVLWSLQTLLEYFENVRNPKDINGYALQHGLLDRLFPGHSVGHLLQASNPLCDQLNQIIGDINQVVYDLYSYEPSPPELEDNWVKVIQEFDGFGTKLNIFTTNYDVVIEAALNYIMGDITGRQWCGIKGNVRQLIDLSNWTEERHTTRSC